jgi:nitrite reductase (NADH) large subunit
MQIVIIGASAAGLACLSTLGRIAPQAKITIVSAEPYSPYSRCLLTYYIGRSLTEEELMISSPADYPSSVRFLAGQRAEQIDAATKTVRLSGGDTLGYDKLLIAVGADAVKPIYCDEEKGTFTLRTLDDAKKIAGSTNSKAVVTGGGFIGIKTAYGFLERHVKTEMVIASPHPLAMVLDEASARYLERDLKAMGLGITTGDDIATVGIHNCTVNVALVSGKVLACDVVVVGKGVKPSVDLARDAGIKINEGITVSEYLETSAPEVFAAGDCCETLDLARNKVQLIGLWPAAVEQGYYAALNMAGYKSRYPGSVAMNSVKTKSFHLISAGVLKGEAGLTIHEKYVPLKKQFRKIACRGNVPVGMAFYNCPEEAGLFVNLIKKAVPLIADPEKIVNGEVAVSDLMKPL